MNEVLEVFIILLILIVASLLGLFVISPKLKPVHYPLYNYDCDDLKQALLNDTCLVKLKSPLFYSCYDVNEMYINYKLRCG